MFAMLTFRSLAPRVDIVGVELELTQFCLFLLKNKNAESQKKGQNFRRCKGGTLKLKH